MDDMKRFRRYRRKREIRHLRMVAHNLSGVYDKVDVILGTLGSGDRTTDIIVPLDIPIEQLPLFVQNGSIYLNWTVEAEPEGRTLRLRLARMEETA